VRCELCRIQSAQLGDAQSHGTAGPRPVGVALLLLGVTVMLLFHLCGGPANCSNEPPHFLKGTRYDCRAIGPTQSAEFPSETPGPRQRSEGL